MRKIILFFSILFLWTCGGGGGKKATGPVDPPAINPPTAAAVTINTNEDIPATFNFLGSDPQNLVLTYTAINQSRTWDINCKRSRRNVYAYCKLLWSR